MRSLHRHLFFVEVTTAVNHHEREIEFHDLLDTATHLFKPQMTDSCETLAYNLARDLRSFMERGFRVSVFEDNECGATVEVE